MESIIVACITGMVTLVGVILSNSKSRAVMDAPQVAEYPRVSKTSAYKLTERQEIPARRAGRLLRVRKDELDETLRAQRRWIQVGSTPNRPYSYSRNLHIC